MKIKSVIWVAGICLIILLYGLFDPDKFLFPRCPFHSLTGLLCPGCGSQRAIHQMLHGNISTSFALNPLLIPGILYAFAAFCIGRFFPMRWPYVRQSFYGVKASYISLIVIGVFWVVRNLI